MLVEATAFGGSDDNMVVDTSVRLLFLRSMLPRLSCSSVTFNALSCLIQGGSSVIYDSDSLHIYKKYIKSNIMAGNDRITLFDDVDGACPSG